MRILSPSEGDRASVVCLVCKRFHVLKQGYTRLAPIRAGMKGAHYTRGDTSKMNWCVLECPILTTIDNAQNGPVTIESKYYPHAASRGEEGYRV
jgi:hypothetical protein